MAAYDHAHSNTFSRLVGGRSIHSCRPVYCLASNFSHARKEGIIAFMFRRISSGFGKLLLVTLFGLFGFTHAVSTVSASASSSMNMMGHGSQSSVQCQSSCIMGLPGSKSDELLQIRKDDEEPKPQPYYTGILAMGVLAALFIIKRSASFATSWRPPDLVTLNSSFLFYA